MWRSAGCILQCGWSFDNWATDRSGRCLWSRRADCFLFQRRDELAHVPEATELIVDHGAKQRAQMYPQRHCDYRFRVTLERLDEIVDLVHALLDGSDGGKSGLICHQHSPEHRCPHDTSCSCGRPPQTRKIECNFWRKNRVLFVPVCTGGALVFLHEQAQKRGALIRTARLDSSRLVNQAPSNT
jgi:hypothetical protein